MDRTQQLRSLLQSALSTPVDAYEQGKALVGELAPEDHAGRSQVLRALGIAARLADTMSKSLEHANGSVREAQLAGDQVLEAEAMMSLAASHAISGDSDSALAVLARAEEMSDGLLSAEVRFQKGAVLHKMGRYEEALGHYREVLPVFVEHGDAGSEAQTRQNVGMIRMIGGQLDEAETELLRARGIYEELELDMPVAAVDHALGELASYRGDLVGALRLLDESEQRYGELVDAVAEIQVSRCEVLLSAGLVSESARLASSIAEVLGKLGLSEDEAEARLVAAQATLVGGDRRKAMERAMEARDLFAEQGRDTWKAQAEQVEITALFEEGEVSQELLLRARDVADHLDREQQTVASMNARLVAASISMAMGDMGAAEQDLSLIAERKTGPVEMRLQSWLGEALLYDIRGNQRRAMAAARSGMELLDRYQAALGASDIRAGVEMHARRLGELGLRLTVESAEARTAFQWMERTRARALRSRPVSPPADDELLTQLADLRQVTAKMRGASGEEALELRRWERTLQDSVQRRARMMPGRGRAADPGDIARKTTHGLEGRTLVEFGSVGERLWAVVVSDGEFDLHEVGPSAEALREMESLRFMLRRMARRGEDRGHGHMEVAGRLDRLLFRGVDLGAGPLIIIPTPDLYAMPWSILPSLHERSVTVSPSAEMWVSRSQLDKGGGGVVVAGGPGLAKAGEEVKAVGDLYQSAAVWGPDDSRTEQVLDAMEGADLAHIASHAYFQYENPMFSSLRLGDGDLFVYDLERLRRPPRRVILSACDSGFSESRAGEELLGLSASLLAMGTRTVVASIGLVPDSDTTRALMLEFHQGLLDGLGPAHSLSQAQGGSMERPGGLVAAASFVCIGAG